MSKGIRRMTSATKLIERPREQYRSLIQHDHRLGNAGDVLQEVC